MERPSDSSALQPKLVVAFCFVIAFGPSMTVSSWTRLLDVLKLSARTVIATSKMRIHWFCVLRLIRFRIDLPLRLLLTQVVLYLKSAFYQLLFQLFYLVQRWSVLSTPCLIVRHQFLARMLTHN